MRPDERAKQSQIDRENTFKGNVNRGVSAAASAGAGAASAALASRVMPFLSEYIPADLAMKGINKVSPQLGSFLQRGPFRNCWIVTPCKPRILRRARWFAKRARACCQRALGRQDSSVGRAADS